MLANKINFMDWMVVLFIVGFTSVTISFVIKLLTTFAGGLLSLF